MAEITLTVNGELFTFSSNQTLANLITFLCIPEAGLIVEYNETLYRDNFNTIQLQSGDVIDFIHFMGGGS